MWRVNNVSGVLSRGSSQIARAAWSSISNLDWSSSESLEETTGNGASLEPDGALIDRIVFYAISVIFQP